VTGGCYWLFSIHGRSEESAGEGEREDGKREEADEYLSNDIRTTTAAQAYDSADDAREEQDADGDVKGEFDSGSGVKGVKGEELL